MPDDMRMPGNESKVSRWILQFWGVISSLFLVVVGAFTLGNTLGKTSMHSRVDEVEQKAAYLTKRLEEVEQKAAYLTERQKEAKGIREFLASYLSYMIYRDMTRQPYSGDHAGWTKLVGEFKKAEDSFVGLVRDRRGHQYDETDTGKVFLIFVDKQRESLDPAGSRAQLTDDKTEWPVPREIKERVHPSASP